ncbi:MAG: hypothetical protein Q8O26_19840 [Phreatobacter sp.]|uniref:hypothetical protein n=1 Tax=Phreatobacter sp. TaxID=1966341 RepID=UPI002734822B|nr:hypothetical protein [Phreatobacter sp.]MDP2804130.1 hypothetical protein [Phreatobacter sp.]
MATPALPASPRPVPAGGHDHGHAHGLDHGHDLAHAHGHAGRRTVPGLRIVSALTMSATGRLLAAGLLAATLWLLALWAMT